MADLRGAGTHPPPISHLQKIFYTAYFTCAEQIRIIYNVNQPAFIITCKPQIDKKSMLYTCLAGKRRVVASVSLAGMRPKVLRPKVLLTADMNATERNAAESPKAESNINILKLHKTMKTMSFPLLCRSTQALL